MHIHGVECAYSDASHVFITMYVMMSLRTTSQKRLNYGHQICYIFLICLILLICYLLPLDILIVE